MAIIQLGCTAELTDTDLSTAYTYVNSAVATGDILTANGGGSCTKVSIYKASTGRYLKGTIVVYEDDGAGSPGDLVASVAIDLDTSDAEGWYDFTLTSFTITDGIAYYCGLISDSGNLLGVNSDTGNAMVRATSTTLLDPWVADLSSRSYCIPMYIEYDNGGATTFNTTYDGNGYDGGTVPTDSADYADGDTVTVLDNTGTLTRTGYTFSGWNTQADGLGTSYVASDTFTISADTTLYAVWVGIDRTLTYNGNGSDGGTVPVDGSSPYENGDTVTVLDNTGTLTLTGYVFNGWNTASDGTGTTYTVGDTFDISADTILYAVWALTYTLTYNGNGFDGGTVPVDGSSPYASGSDVTVLGNTGSLTLTGYTFNGWNTSSDGTGTSYVEGDTLSGISADTILYVVWASTYTVTYSGNGSDGGVAPTDSTDYADGSDVTILDNTGSLTLTGYIFVAWNTASDGTGTNYEASDIFSGISADTILYALWKTEAELIEAYLTPSTGGYLLEAEYYGG